MNSHQRRIFKRDRQRKRDENLILLICEKSKDDPNFDDDKLKWLLFHVDMTAFVKLGHPISSFVYTKEAA
jgi:hypothetical protein